MIERVATRLRFDPDRTVTVLTGKVELGQGLSDALTLICSVELALEPGRIRVCGGDTGRTPDDGLTAGSGSMEIAGAAIRAAAGAARFELIRRAAARLQVAEHCLLAEAGAIRPRAGVAAGDPCPASVVPTGDRYPPRDGGGAAPATGSSPSGAGVDYWDLLAPEEVGAPLSPWAASAEAVETPAPGAGREDVAHTTTGRPGSAGEVGPPPANRGAASDARPKQAVGAARERSWRRVDRVVRTGGGFVHDLRLPGMVHGRVLRPPGYGHRLVALPAEAARAMRGVLAVVVDGSFVAVAAEREEQANAAHGVLAAGARWQRRAGRDPPPDGGAALRALSEAGRSLRDVEDDENGARGRSRPPAFSDQAPVVTTPILRRGSGRPGAPAATVTATYSRPFLMHAALGPSAAAARLDRSGDLTIWSHTQGPYELRAALAEVLQRAPERIRVIHVDGSGCYGHNGADDAALDAALLAAAVPERPVLVKWTRADENRWEPFGTAMTVTCHADLDAAGSVAAWRHEVRSHAHSTRPRGTPGHSTLLAAWHRAAALTPPAPRNGSGLTAGPQRNAEPRYDFPAIDVTVHFAPEAPVRVSALRSLGAFANVFAVESFMDELASLGGEDALTYRLRHLRDERARQVLTEAVRAAPAVFVGAPRTIRQDARAAPAAAPGGSPAGPRSGSPATAARTAQLPAEATAAAPLPDAGDALVGRGIAVAQYKNLQSYVAVVCDVAVDPGSGEIRLLHATLAVDAGRVVDRDGLANQIEGGFLQAASWTLKEEVRWDEAGIRSIDWDTYPVLRFSEVPPVAVRLIDRPDLPSVGAGEAAQGPTPAAIANAVFAAAGVRLRDTPFTPARVMAALSRAEGPASSEPVGLRQAPRQGPAGPEAAPQTTVSGRS